MNITAADLGPIVNDTAQHEGFHEIDLLSYDLDDHAQLEQELADLSASITRTSKAWGWS